jgi:arginyl-tRNA synthetase
MNLLAELRAQFETALAPLTPKAGEYARLVRTTQDAQHGDYQANCAMPLAKELKSSPRDVAAKIVDALPNKERFKKIDVAGPGFINMTLADDYLAAQLPEVLADERLGVPQPANPKTMVIDYSSPNVAKPMHVGHLRSTVIGDAIARIHRALGWKVIADNHLGDWGLQFGMLILGWRTERDPKAAEDNPLQELARLYKLIISKAESDPAVAEAARLETAKLHAGDEGNLALWRLFMPWCLEDLDRIYKRLGVEFDHYFGESFYQPMLADTVKKLETAGIAMRDQGAVAIFFPDPSGKKDKDGNLIPLYPPFVIQKTDGAFTYATSDLACIDDRVQQFKPDVIVYVVDDRQSLHFQQLFAAARTAGYTEVDLVHVKFGKILGRDGKPFKTREGTVTGLTELLDEAIRGSRRLIDELQESESDEDRIPEEERDNIAEVVGLGAVKYADLSQNRVSDYVYDEAKMIALQGDTAPYLQYAYARNRSIFRKADVSPETFGQSPPAVMLEHPSERALGLKLLQYPEALEAAALDYRPNILANYLYDLANVYGGFFRDCPVLKAPSDELKSSRLVLCELTARILRHGLGLLGIGVVERM